MIAFRSMIFASVTLLHLTGASVVLAQTVSPSVPQNSQEQMVLPPQPVPQPAATRSPTSQLAQPNSDAAEAVPLSQGVAPACPAGQFASAFPDVSPEDWTYEAVNRLSALPLQCFPVVPQS